VHTLPFINHVVAERLPAWISPDGLEGVSGVKSSREVINLHFDFEYIKR
jgi:hypothetical protein